MTKEDIVKRVEENCEEYNITEYPVKIVELCKQYDITVFEEYLPPEVSGFIVIKEGTFEQYDTGRLIVVNLSELASRRRFTIAHELGHYILHKKVDEELYAHRDAGGSSQEEQEANFFASNILMPKDLINQALDMCDKSLSSISDYYKIEYIAEQFAVSKSAAQIRLEQLGII